MLLQCLTDLFKPTRQTKAYRDLEQRYNKLNREHQICKEKSAMMQQSIDMLARDVLEQKAIVDYALLEKEQLEAELNTYKSEALTYVPMQTTLPAPEIEPSKKKGKSNGK